jgi:hypothetical protein
MERGNPRSSPRTEQHMASKHWLTTKNRIYLQAHWRVNQAPARCRCLVWRYQNSRISSAP